MNKKPSTKKQALHAINRVSDFGSIVTSNMIVFIKQDLSEQSYHWKDKSNWQMPVPLPMTTDEKHTPAQN